MTTTTTEVGTARGWRPVAAVRLREGAVYPWRVRQPAGDGDASGTIRAVGAARGRAHGSKRRSTRLTDGPRRAAGRIAPRPAPSWRRRLRRIQLLGRSDDSRP